MRSSIAELALRVGRGGEPPPVDPDEARRAADEILSRPEYQEPQQSLVDRAIEWVFERVGDLFSRLGGSGPGSVIGWLVLAGLAGAALWLIIRALRVPRRGRPGSGDDVVYGTERRLDATVWLDEAERLAAAGDHRGALRCRHQALIARVVTDGLVDDVAGRTAGEYGAALAGRLPHLAEPIHRLTEQFEWVWYGGRPVGASDYEHFRSAAAEIESAPHDRSVHATSTGSAT